MAQTNFEDIFGWLPLPSFRRRRAVERIVKKLPQCSRSIVVASPDYRDEHYHCDVIASVKGVLQWMNDHDSFTWMPGPYQDHRRVAFYTWLSAYDPIDASTIMLPALFVDLLQSDVPRFVADGIASVYCRECRAIYDTVQMSESKRIQEGPYTYWTTEWHCDKNHLLHHEDRTLQALRYLGREIDALEQVAFTTVYILDKTGVRTIQWKIGEDITFKDFLAARDFDSGDLYAVTEIVSGNEQTRLCGKEEWYERAQRNLG